MLPGSGAMAQPITRDLVRDLLDVLELPDPVVEFGALHVEANQDNDLRPLFAGRSFTGTDMRPGPGVDRVEDLRALTFGDGEVGTAICLDTLEHCADPLGAVRELHRVLKPGGVCVISSVMLFGIHGYPQDFFRFTPEGFRVLLEPFDGVWVQGIGDPDIPREVFGVGVKGGPLDLALDRLPRTRAWQERWEAAADGVRIGPFRVPVRELAATCARELPRLARLRLSAAARRGRAGTR
jgi:SAM-dependent methyltransferase